MKIRILMLILVLTTAGSARAEEQKTAEADLSWENYQVIVEQNIFKKDRAPRPVEEHVSYTPEEPVITSPQSYILLTGIISQENEYLAFVENRRTGTTTRVKAGDSVAEGHITEITAECLKFEAPDGELYTVELGESLQGTAPGSAPAVRTTSDGADSTAKTLGTSNEKPAPANSILERMRQRRLQELNK